MPIDVNESCVGCSACSQICPNNAITMQLSDEGFLYPEIDKHLCCDCSLCQKVCPLDAEKAEETVPTAFYGWHMDDGIRFRSSSGGLFSALAEYVLNRSGVVFGAAFDGINYVYKSTEDVDIDVLRKSKYTEVWANNSFSRAKELLDQGVPVLFVGTPCRIAGFRCFLRKEYENLILVDFLCGGVASPKFLAEDLSYHESRNHAKIQKIDFRSKKNGWGGQYVMQFDYSNGKTKYVLAREDAYFTGFLSKLINRKSCYECKYVKKHFSDITMADFWDYKKIENLKKDRKGISLAVVHTSKGHDIMQRLERFTFFPVDFDIVAGNFKKAGNYIKRLEDRNAFFENAKRGFIQASKVYMKPGEIISFKIKNVLKVLLHK